jgi:hypothetical protein
MARYAIYTRQSVDKGDEFSSCEVQFLTCQDSANATGGTDLHWTGQRFDDHGHSGTTLDRPAMRKRCGRSSTWAVSTGCTPLLWIG